jgi:hypothetical protein
LLSCARRIQTAMTILATLPHCKPFQIDYEGLFMPAIHATFRKMLAACDTDLEFDHIFIRLRRLTREICDKVYDLYKWGSGEVAGVQISTGAKHAPSLRTMFAEQAAGDRDVPLPTSDGMEDDLGMD